MMLLQTVFVLCVEKLLLFVQGVLSIPCKSLFNPTHHCKGPCVITFRVSTPTLILLSSSAFQVIY